MRGTSVLTKKPILHLTAGAPRYGTPHDDVLAPGVPGEQHLEGGEQRHVQRGALPLAQCPQARRGTSPGSAVDSCAPSFGQHQWAGIAVGAPGSTVALAKRSRQ